MRFGRVWTFVKRQEAGIGESQLGNQADVGVGDPSSPMELGNGVPPSAVLGYVMVRCPLGGEV